MHRQLERGRYAFSRWTIQSLDGLIHFGTEYQYESAYGADDLIKTKMLVQVGSITAQGAYYYAHAQLLRFAEELDSALNGKGRFCYIGAYDYDLDLRFQFTRKGSILITGRVRDCHPHFGRDRYAELSIWFTTDRASLANTLGQLRLALAELDKEEEHEDIDGRLHGSRPTDVDLEGKPLPIP